MSFKQLIVPCCSPAVIFLEKRDGFIGSQYKKVVYKQFTNDKFTKEVARTPDMEHLGIMGKNSSDYFGVYKCFKRLIFFLDMLFVVVVLLLDSSGMFHVALLLPPAVFPTFYVYSFPSVFEFISVTNT